MQRDVMTPDTRPAGSDRPPADLTQTIDLIANGVRRSVAVPAWATLLDVLRERLHLFGTKKGCDHGLCGACTVHVDGRRVVSCLSLAVAHDGERIDTIEGVADGDRLHPLQEAFIGHDAFQCGYCTPGQIMSALGHLDEGGGLGDEELAEGITNQCRCGCYQNIVAAIREASHETTGQPRVGGVAGGGDR